jgi:uncharacterized protein DUF4158
MFQRLVQRAPRLIYPELPTGLTPEDLRRLFNPSYSERQWAKTIARTPASQVALLVQLMVFQTLGRLRRLEQIPAAVVEHVAKRVGVEVPTPLAHAERTLYRHRSATFKYLNVTPWCHAARALAQSAMLKIAEIRNGPAELINGAVDVLVRGRFELPALAALRRMAGTVCTRVNLAQWKAVASALGREQRCALEALLVVDGTGESPFARLCRASGRPTRKNLQGLIDRYHWLEHLPDSTTAFRGISDAKILRWANEARRLKAPELREYLGARRLTLLLAAIRQARGQVLDDLTRMLLKHARRIARRSEERLDEWRTQRADATDGLIRAFRDSLIVHGSEEDPQRRIDRLNALFAGHGGRRRSSGPAPRSCAMRSTTGDPLRGKCSCH